MAIQSYDDYIASNKQKMFIYRLLSNTVVAAAFYSMAGTLGFPGANTSYAIGNVTSGIVPSSGPAFNAPRIDSFANSAVTGYLTRVEAHNTVACMILLYDRVFSAGAFAMGTTSNTYTLTSQPSFDTKLPYTPTGTANVDYRGLEIWYESVTSLSNHDHSIAVNYNDETGNAANTGNISSQNIATASGMPRLVRMPLAANTMGVSRINSVTAVGVASATGLFNIHILRPLARVRIAGVNYYDCLTFDRLGLPQVFANTSLFPLYQIDSTAVGLPWIGCEIANY